MILSPIISTVIFSPSLMIAVFAAFINCAYLSIVQGRKIYDRNNSLNNRITTELAEEA
jgi:hypothetical protein